MQRTGKILVWPLIFSACVLLSALPNRALGGQIEIACETKRCSYDVKGGSLVLRFRANKIGCQAVAGRGQLETTTTGSTELNLFGCREELTPFHFACVGSGRARSPIQMKAMGTHLMTSSHRTPKILLLGARAFLGCGDGLQFKIEGYWVGYIGPFECGISRRGYAVDPVLYAHGQRGTGPIYDVYVRENRDGYRVPDPWSMDFAGQAALGC